MVHSDFYRFASADVSLLRGYPRYVICNAQSCCERLVLADVDRCTAMKSECTEDLPQGGVQILNTLAQCMRTLTSCYNGTFTSQSLALTGQIQHECLYFTFKNF